MRRDIAMKPLVILLLSSGVVSNVNADGIWPFNTTFLQVRLLCNNSADVAERAATGRDRGYTLSEILDGYGDPDWNRDPVDRLHKQVYIRATRLAFKNKFVSPETIYDMQYNICYAQKEKYEKIFDSLDP
jgi:hypothetical protein